MGSSNIYNEEYSDCEQSKPTIRVCKIERNSGSYGFHLTRTKWDPYPWIAGVEKDSLAECAGLKVGDCILEINGDDVIGLKIAEIAKKVINNQDSITILLWNAGNDSSCDSESVCCSPMPTSLTRLSSCLSSILSSMECPVCLEVVPPPAHQCPLGHLICFKCHAYTERCPICRTRFNKERNLLADKIYEALIEAFQLKSQPVETHSMKLWGKLFGKKKRQQQKQRIENLEAKLNSPELKNKFLSRLMGKASSVDNLSSTSVLLKNEPFPLRKKSLSSNELFRPSRSRYLSSNYGSFQGSIVSLIGNVLPDIGSENQEIYFKCPCDKSCLRLSTHNDIMYHIQETHDGPILQYFQPEFAVNFPFSVPELTVITMFCYEKLFFIKIIQDPPGDIKIHIWILGSSREASNFKTIATFFVPDNDQITELTFKTFVTSLDDKDSPCGVFRDQIIVTKSTMDAYFSSNSFSLSISIISMR